MYDIIQHADNLSLYFILNRETGKIVIHHMSFETASEVANALELYRVAIMQAEQDKQAIEEEWPMEISV